MNGAAPRRDFAGAAWRGTVAAMAMSGVRELTTSLGLLDRPPPDEIAEDGVPALFAPIPRRYRPAAIELAHWGYGAGAGLAYDLAPRQFRRRGWFGLVYGLAIWALFERAVVPVLGLRPARERPLRERAAIAGDHLLFGAVISQRPFDPRA